MNNDLETVKEHFENLVNLGGDSGKDSGKDLGKDKFYFVANNVFPKLLKDKNHKNNINSKNFIPEYICETVNELYKGYYFDDHTIVCYDKYVRYNLLDRIPERKQIKSTYLKQLLFENHQSLDVVLDKCLSLKPTINENVKLLLFYYRKKDKIVSRYLAHIPLDVVDIIIDYSD